MIESTLDLIAFGTVVASFTTLIVVPLTIRFGTSDKEN